MMCDWISVEDGLPDSSYGQYSSYDVLICTGNRFVCPGFYIAPDPDVGDDAGWWRTDWTRPHKGVTHWMPLPEPPPGRP